LCAIAILSLAACNSAMTEQPMICPQDRSPVSLKPGIWSEQPICPAGVDEGSPSKFDCTHPLEGLAVTGTKVRQIFPTKMPPDLPEISVAYVIDDGDPMLVQGEMRGKDESQGKDEVGYVYVALEPTERDAAGVITAATVWAVMCGPPPQPGDDNYDILDEEGQLTNHPLDGMTMNASGCEPRDVAALRAAATASRPYSLQFKVRYVRDGPAQ